MKVEVEITPQRIADPLMTKLVGMRVRTVERHGCMAHIEKNERWGNIVRMEMRVIYGSREPNRWAWVRFDNGKEEWVCAWDNYMFIEGDHLVVKD